MAKLDSKQIQDEKKWQEMCKKRGIDPDTGKKIRVNDEPTEVDPGICQETDDSIAVPRVVIIAGMPYSGDQLLAECLADASNDLLFAPPGDEYAYAVLAIRDQWQKLIRESAAEEMSAVCEFIEKWNFLSEDRRNSATASVCKKFPEIAAQPERIRFAAVTMAVLESAFEDVGIDQTMVFNSAQFLPLIEALKLITCEPLKVLVPIRNYGSILAEAELDERKIRASGKPLSETLDYLKAQSIGGRCEIYSRRDHPVGQTAARIHDAWFRGVRDSLHLVNCEKLHSDTDEVLQKALAFLGIESDSTFESQSHLQNNFHSTFPNGIADMYKKMWKEMGIKIG